MVKWDDIIDVNKGLKKQIKPKYRRVDAVKHPFFRPG